MGPFQILDRAPVRPMLLAVTLLVTTGVPLRADKFPDENSKPKLGIHALPLQHSHDYLQRRDAPDYWVLSPFYVSQTTSSDCSVATLAIALNALRGLPRLAKEPLITQAALRERLGPELAEKTRDRGEGVRFAEFRKFLLMALEAYELDARIELFRPGDSSPAMLQQLRQILSANERSSDDIALVYYNQGVVTGDWDGPHLSPIGAYDAERGRVLILDVDRKWYGPYWTPEEKLLEAMLRPAPGHFGSLAGETGGIIRVSRRRGN
jgi:Phytochelatin synthase